MEEGEVRQDGSSEGNTDGRGTPENEKAGCINEPGGSNAHVHGEYQENHDAGTTFKMPGEKRPTQMAAVKETGVGLGNSVGGFSMGRGSPKSPSSPIRPRKRARGQRSPVVGNKQPDKIDGAVNNSTSMVPDLNNTYEKSNTSGDVQPDQEEVQSRVEESTEGDVSRRDTQLTASATINPGGTGDPGETEQEVANTVERLE
ncbi:hypothetical protein Hanom_Chr04g00290141 [Helianthus anomalus]